MTVEKLKQLRNYDDIEFKYQLRTLLKKSQIKDLPYFLKIVNEFKREILFDSFFFLDILNESIFYFYEKNKEKEEISVEIMELLKLVAPVGDRTTLDIIRIILKRIARHSPHYPILLNYYGEIEHKISFLEQKITKNKLYPPKNLLTEWHESL